MAHSDVDMKAARKSLVQEAKEYSRKEKADLEDEGLDVTSSYNAVAAYRGVGLGMYFKIIPWLVVLMLWMMLCSVPYLIVINTSVFTDEAHQNENDFGVKVYDNFELSSFTFAAIVDDKNATSTLEYINTNIANTWKGPMRKGVFLTWISLVDAGAIAVFTAICTFLFFVMDRWLDAIDDRTREVSDYSIVVGGLPRDATATEIGAYFQKHFGDGDTDKVMDVVLIKDLHGVIRACKKAHKYEGLKKFIDGLTSPKWPAATAKALSSKGEGPEDGIEQPTAPTGGVGANDEAPAAGISAARPKGNSAFAKASKRLYHTDTKMEANRVAFEDMVNEGALHTNAAFVTFNTERMRIKAVRALPSGWWSALFIRKEYILERPVPEGEDGVPRSPRLGRPVQTKFRIWVQKAAAPEDYRFENLAWRGRTNIAIQCCTGIIMFGFMIVCAAFITWLSAESDKKSRELMWQDETLVTNIRSTFGAASLLNSTGLPVARRTRFLLANSTAATTSNLTAELAQYVPYCTTELQSTCAPYIRRAFPQANFTLAFGSVWRFGDTTARLLYERPIRRELLRCSEGQRCSDGGMPDCLPCYCLGLKNIPTSNASADFLDHIKDTCSSYWTPFDMQRDGIKTGISFAIALINSLLVIILRWFKFNLEKHWTTTDTEYSFALWSYIVKLINSVAVLLVVNCSTLASLQKDAVEGNHADQKNTWIRNLVLNGLYDDFTPAWYESVGFSILILMMINVTGPFVRTLSDYGLKVFLQCRLGYLHGGTLAPPDQYYAAFRTPQFTLELRTAEVLFNLTLALLFGSGMPLCYLICAVQLVVTLAWDRVSLLALNQPAPRYTARMPAFIMQMLPVLVIAHCAFGLWMHTYFKAEMSSMDVMSAAAKGLSKPGINDLSNNKLSARITQPNGLALLICFVFMVFWLAFGRWVVWGALKLVGRSCMRLAACLRKMVDDGGEGSPITFEAALSSSRKAHMLHGARTYRLHHLAGYAEFLRGDAGRLWALAQGEERYTRLTSFRVRVEVAVGVGRDRRVEEREVEMFDISDAVISHVPRLSRLSPALFSPSRRTPGPTAGRPSTGGIPLGGLEAAPHGAVPSAALQAAALSLAAAAGGPEAVVQRMVLTPSGAAGVGVDVGLEFEFGMDGAIVPVMSLPPALSAALRKEAAGKERDGASEQEELGSGQEEWVHAGEEEGRLAGEEEEERLRAGLLGKAALVSPGGRPQAVMRVEAETSDGGAPLPARCSAPLPAPGSGTAPAAEAKAAHAQLPGAVTAPGGGVVLGGAAAIAVARLPSPGPGGEGLHVAEGDEEPATADPVSVTLSVDALSVPSSPGRATPAAAQTEGPNFEEIEQLPEASPPGAAAAPSTRSAAELVVAVEVDAEEQAAEACEGAVVAVPALAAPGYQPISVGASAAIMAVARAGEAASSGGAEVSAGGRTGKYSAVPSAM